MSIGEDPTLPGKGPLFEVKGVPQPPKKRGIRVPRAKKFGPVNSPVQRVRQHWRAVKERKRDALAEGKAARKMGRIRKAFAKDAAKGLRNMARVARAAKPRPAKGVRRNSSIRPKRIRKPKRNTSSKAQRVGRRSSGGPRFRAASGSRRGFRFGFLRKAVSMFALAKRTLAGKKVGDFRNHGAKNSGYGGKTGRAGLHPRKLF